MRVKQTEFIRAEMYARLGPMLQGYNILLCPTLAVPSVDAWHNSDDPDFAINGKHVDAALIWCLTYPFNLLGQLPAISVQSRFANSGVPTGLQIVGRPLDDLTVFRAAAAFDQARPWRHRRPGF